MSRIIPNLSIFLLMATISLSCSRSELSNQFDCKTKQHFGNTKTYTDVLKHFEIDIPKNWKTNLYYDEFQSKLFSADTTKNLSKTFVIDISWNQGELNIDDEFKENVLVKLKNEKLTTLKSGNISFKDLPAYYNYSQGKYGKYGYTYLQIYIKAKTDEYYLLQSKVYGDEFIDERICSSVDLFEEIKLK